jgi:hypothetical protein
MKTKENIIHQTAKSEKLTPVLEELRKADCGFKVPDGYFDSLSPRIVDRINRKHRDSFTDILFSYFHKPVIWAPSLAIIVIAVLFVFLVPTKKNIVIPATDEWTELNMAYDASYAEEAILKESAIIDIELASSTISKNESLSIVQKEPTDDEIREYLKDHETENDILTEY